MLVAAERFPVLVAAEPSPVLVAAERFPVLVAAEPSPVLVAGAFVKSTLPSTHFTAAWISSGSLISASMLIFADATLVSSPWRLSEPHCFTTANRLVFGG